MPWTQILYLIAAVALVWFAYRMIRGNPQLFSKENLEKSFFSMGILALGLIVFIALLVFLLKSG
ncbi:MAG: hypothetical protein ACD_42C00232G0002 [uncultured bacterium]|nr:MAG: hypothetical protein ACD_42C00232G0002 [uncultured bacterium]OGT33376.1 MAG: hypothetical protein A3C44_04090 [Gammaproteobacteria bacterium RIFCSPHIGHO2_02_FULL_39_13]OGT50317.1 MAG: hypothetical protein A3E53_01015 [Gammaproteobacteria bacterium RIFCSPHIGHO2_12_FULL_39_24]